VLPAKSERGLNKFLTEIFGAYDKVINYIDYRSFYTLACAIL
jgi:hypothetical protein